MEQIALAQPDDSLPSEQRQAKLRAAAEANIQAGKDPYAGVSIRTRGEVNWILEQHAWSGDVDGYKKTRPNLCGADLFGIDLRGIVLAGADLRDAYCERANLSTADLRLANLSCTNFVAANLTGARLIEANLEKANLSLAKLEDANLAGATLAEANLYAAHLDRAYLFLSDLHGAALNGASLKGCTLTRADLTDSRLTGADLRGASLADAILHRAALDRARLSNARLDRAILRGATAVLADLSDVSATEANLDSADLALCDLRGADLRSCQMNVETTLDGVQLADRHHSISLADVRWNGVDITVIDWSLVRSLSDEKRLANLDSAASSRPEAPTLERQAQIRLRSKRRMRRLDAARAAVRANRQLATHLRDQGLNEDANRFAYRAQVLQRRVLLHEKKYAQYLFSLLLDGLAGYGYVPVRSLVAYAIVIAAYAVAYSTFGIHGGQHLPWFAALVVSLTAFHGRGFFPADFSPADPQAILAASEAVLGLIIEVSFIATFTQRFFGK